MKKSEIISLIWFLIFLFWFFNLILFWYWINIIEFYKWNKIIKNEQTIIENQESNKFFKLFSSTNYDIYQDWNILENYINSNLTNWFTTSSIWFDVNKNLRWNDSIWIYFWNEEKTLKYYDNDLKKLYVSKIIDLNKVMWKYNSWNYILINKEKYKEFLENNLDYLQIRKYLKEWIILFDIDLQSNNFTIIKEWIDKEELKNVLDLIFN